ncbi:MAG: flagellin N-terminal helical domain-containing protein [Desulfotomaculales bacterium]
MRVSTFQAYENLITRLRGSYARLEQSHERLASGRTASRPGDDPAAVTRAMAWRSALAEVRRFQRDLGQEAAYLQTVDDALGRAAEVVQNVREHLTRAVSGALTAEDYRTIAGIVDRLVDELVAVANTTHGDVYVFGGLATGSPPFVREGDTVTYTGPTDVRRSLSPAPGLSWDATFYGEQLFLSSGLVDAVVEVRDLLREPLAEGETWTGRLEQLSAQLGVLDRHLENLNAARARAGDLAAAAQAFRNLLTDQELNLAAALSNAEDLDLAEATVELRRLELAYQAVLASAARLMETGLLQIWR